MRTLIRPEHADDAAAVRVLVAAAFAGHPHGDGSEPAIVDALRAADQLSIALVAEDLDDTRGGGPAMTGHVAFSPVDIVAPAAPAATVAGAATSTAAPTFAGWYGLGPVSVRPDVQGRGLGQGLIRAGLDRLRVRGASGCVVFGDPAYYARFGFRVVPDLWYPGAPDGFFQALAFDAASVPSGPVTYAPAFGPVNRGYDPAHLVNALWHTLSGPHRRFSIGTDTARRYAPGYSQIAGFHDMTSPDFDALAPYCRPGERFWCEGWTGVAPAGWAVAAERRMIRMVRDTAGPLPAPGDAPAGVPGDIITLGPEHAAQAVALAELTKPGPFGPRTFEYGEYLGIVENGRLVAMAGERFELPGLREVSGICTHPDWQGRGLAKRLTLTLLSHVHARHEVPFLQVAVGNEAAHRLYLGLGFRDHSEPVFRIIERVEAD